MDLKVVLIALPLMTLLCFLSMASSAATPTIDYIHPEDGFYGDQPHQRNMLQEGRRTPLWMDVQALLSFKKHINDPSGKLSNWTTGNWEEACFWYGISCTHQNARVVAIVLRRLNLAGTIPIEFGRLVKLELLDLSYNSLTGHIPPIVSNCTKLRTLVLSDNNFTGFIPAEFGSLVKLELLDLYQNSLTDHIPPTVSNCTKLRTLVLSYNYFTGTIPAEFGSLVKLELLALSHNSFTGHIPPTVSNCTKLWTLILSYNYFIGTIPAEFGSLVKLELLALSHNNFTGSIPTMFGHLDQLQHIDLGSNSISGQVPPTLGNCTRLQSLNLSDNQLSGIIPESIFGNSLKIFEVSWNSLNGDMEMRFPVSMVIFSVISNNFTGSFPSSLANCSDLKVIDLRKNRFSGEIPLYLSCPQLQILSLGYNKFSGGIPPWITNLIKLQILDLSNNRFSGRIPDNVKLQALAAHTIFHQKIVLYYGPGIVIQGSGYLLLYVSTRNAMLDLSNNNLTGDIPASIGSLGWLRLLNLSGNHLEGQIPPSLGSISTLQQLDLSKNNLSGWIPQELFKLSELAYLDVSFNNLCGSIPKGTRIDTFSVASFQGNKCLCGYPLPTCEENKCLCGSPLPSWKGNKKKSVECVDRKNNVKVGWLHYIDEKMSLISLGIGAIIGFGGVLIVFIVWKKARDWMVPPNVPKRFYGEYRLPT